MAQPECLTSSSPVLRGSSREMSQLDRLEVKHGVKNYANAVEVKEDIGWRPGERSIDTQPSYLFKCPVMYLYKPVPFTNLSVKLRLPHLP